MRSYSAGAVCRNLATLELTRMPSPPAGTVTFLMTDIEGSTRLWEEYGDRFIPILDAHNRLVREKLNQHGGHEVKTEGDSFFYVFGSASEALAGSVDVQYALHGTEPAIRVRIGLHTGEPTLRDNDYFGPHVNRTARIRDAAHGGMTLASAATSALVADRLPAGVSLTDRGEHRLRDLTEPERLYQVIHAELPADFPPLRTLDAQPNNLPARRNNFIGRRRELDVMHELLVKGSARLITLTGPGGVGKSRLALQVAEDHLVDFPDGVWFVPLGSIEHPDQLMPEIAATVLGQMPMSGDVSGALKSYLANKRVLVVLDNFEHILAAAPQLGGLLASLPQLKCLVTSRALLHIAGEQEFSVPSLGDVDSLQLFTERGQAARPGFALDAQTLQIANEICRQLDGLPLAIELAAARLRGMSPSQIAQRIGRRFDILSGGGRDAPDRQRTMRAALDWSYEPLTQDERRLFAQLSVFAEGFFIDAAEEVCDGEDVLEGIFTLRDNSLLYTFDVPGETRYQMLTLIREYASEKVEDAVTLHTRHAEHYLRMAQDWGNRVNSSEQKAALARLDLEQANMEAAIRWADETLNWRMVAEFVEALGEYSYTRGRITPYVFEVVQRAASALQGAEDTASQATLLFALGAIAWMQRRYPEGETCVATSLKFYRANRLHARACRALSLLGLIAADQGRGDLARQRYQEGLQLCEEADCLLEKGLILQNFSVLEMQLGNDEEAQRLAKEGLRIHRSWGDEAGASYQVHTLGLLADRRGDKERARKLLAESLSIRETVGDLPGLANSFGDIGRLCLREKDVENAALLLFAARRLESSCLLPTSQQDAEASEQVRAMLAPAALSAISLQAAELPIGEIIGRAKSALDAAS
jgi:predicted ATPase/class 3 adenylate cyclase